MMVLSPLGVDVPNSEGRLAGRHDELRHVESDIAHAAVLDGGLDRGNVFDIHFHEGGELVPLSTGGAVGCAFVEQESENVLLVTAGAFSGLVRFVATGLFVKIDDVDIRLGVDACAEH